MTALANKHNGGGGGVTGKPTASSPGAQGARSGGQDGRALMTRKETCTYCELKATRPSKQSIYWMTMTMIHAADGMCAPSSWLHTYRR
eukprot:CAMPEP_0119424400 /NCGR_PEP_ID=MMETSP1335-20130426/32474_1 /TAXON_ID=259385 /ORGANISM="Chrysoculter rhomboideus, Strain RCC1486" /LENGTH=87 /DNA_ID=CAMNT_0007449921 /DNA_START=9 /DNA_END=268 /DNA_ORIENTATION=-